MTIDSVKVNPGQQGDAINVALDNIGGIKYPIYKHAYGKENEVTLVSKQNPLPVDTQLDRGAFGSLSVNNLVPIIDVEFSYVLHPELVETRENNGSASIDTNRMKLSTGAAANQSAELLTRTSIKYHGGIGALVRFSGVFTEGVADSFQLIGVGDNSDGFFFGYNGAAFSILRRYGGLPEIRSLQITTKSTTAENITITLDGDADATVAVTDATTGDETTTANDIAAHDFSNLGRGWKAVALGDTVNFISYCAAPYSGAYSLSDATTAVGSFSQKLGGVEPTEEWELQTDWSEDSFDGNGPSEITINPALGNVYQIRYQWLGFGRISFYMEHPADGEFHLVHAINFANTSLIPSIFSPTLPLFAIAQNIANTTDLAVYSSSMGGFSEGEPPEPYVEHVHIINKTFSSTTVVPALTLHNNGVFANKINRIRMRIKSVAVQVDSGKPVIIEVINDATLTGADFNDHSTGESVALFDESATLLEGGEIVKAFPVSSGNDRDKIIEKNLDPTRFITIAGAQAQGGVASVCKIIVTWTEDF